MPEEKKGQEKPSDEIKKAEQKAQEEKKVERPKPEEKSEKKEDSKPAKPEKVLPTNCAVCNKAFKHKKWYYKNGRYFCTKRCWMKFQSEKKKEAEELAAKEAKEREEALKKAAEEKKAKETEAQKEAITKADTDSQKNGQSNTPS
ncbi:MAG: hypothetical protein JW800_04680 [Candidatus Omnitrophica bacterium]|nr:hypothetical protein [Candidatus Omnitrophota bacterium]